jgi:hypothetical protein
MCNIAKKQHREKRMITVDGWIVESGLIIYVKQSRFKKYAIRYICIIRFHANPSAWEIYIILPTFLLNVYRHQKYRNYYYIHFLLSLKKQILKNFHWLNRTALDRRKQVYQCRSVWHPCAQRYLHFQIVTAVGDEINSIRWRKATGNLPWVQSARFNKRESLADEISIAASQFTFRKSSTIWQ